ncbi:DUF960 family protein [Paenibacillus sp. V4I7]|uniref:DUF960 family protein n=1 Tax=Paenibacillus sp. V4I7 TaxID=3042307 RepID=UPI00278983FC|nr:DUF960 family protein [Paenibacillus sp. V4I7]MDQ0902774.1 hypothetical protein [Paenibacillus sp. V4I7]
MFPKHTRYKTHGIEESLSESLQNTLWALIDRDLEEDKQLDYLQTFTLSVVHSRGQVIQRIRQQQEQPKTERVHDILGSSNSLSNIIVWIIDNGTYCTMLLPSEY